MAILRHKTGVTLLVIAAAALLTIGIGNSVRAQIVPDAQMAPEAWQWNGHLWNFSTFKLDNSMARSMTQYMTNSGNNYSGSTDLNIAGASSSQLYESVWRNNQGWTRTVSVVNGAIQWGSAGAWSGPITLSGLPGSGDMQTQVNYRIGNGFIQAIWRSNQGWMRTVPIVNDVIQWGQAPAWGGPLSLSGLPGTGDLQTQGDYAAGNTLIQTIWRSDQGWTRYVPIVNGVVQWSQAGAWSGPLSINTLPGSGSIQASDNFVVGNTYWQTIWRSNQQYTRYAPIINGNVEFGQASDWWSTTSQENLPGSGSVQAQGNYVLVPNTVGGILPPQMIRAEEGQWAPLGYAGYAMPLNAAGNLCYFSPLVPTGNCNMTNAKATSARILFNTRYAYPNRDYLARHEMGHVFGLYHPPCTDPITVMYTGCGVEPPFLQQDEITWINNTY